MTNVLIGKLKTLERLKKEGNIVSEDDHGYHTTYNGYIGSEMIPKFGGLIELHPDRDSTFDLGYSGLDGYFYLKSWFEYIGKDTVLGPIKEGLSVSVQDKSLAKGIEQAENGETMKYDPSEPKTTRKAPKTGKAAMTYISEPAMVHGSRAMAAGAEKHGKHSYHKCQYTSTELIDAMLRHLFKLARGEDYDKETSDILGQEVHHLGNVIANCSIYLDLLARDNLIDDRFEEEK